MYHNESYPRWAYTVPHIRPLIETLDTPPLAPIAADVVDSLFPPLGTPDVILGHVFITNEEKRAIPGLEIQFSMLPTMNQTMLVEFTDDAESDYYLCGYENAPTTISRRIHRAERYCWPIRPYIKDASNHQLREWLRGAGLFALSREILERVEGPPVAASEIRLF
jgi:hypothetical protein